MPKLDLNKLKQYKDEILKAEIGAFLFNLGKTHIGFWKEKKENNQNIYRYFDIDNTSFENIFGFKLFTRYKSYYQKDDNLGKSPFEHELERYNLKNFIFNEKVKFSFQIDDKNEIKWVSFFKGDALEDNEDGKKFISQVFFRGCENINSGIDKGSPDKQLEPPLWLSNAFGSFKEKIKEENFDKARYQFFKNLYRCLNKKGFLSNPGTDLEWQIIRNYILRKIRKWYSHLLSDSRFPINDVTLFDQAYMTASMFKAVLAQLVMNSSKLRSYEDNPSSIKWRILGIQYDKMGLAEKGFKLASIKWYRDISKEIDEEIKKLLEIEYPIGNEIYRDETGIYFIVGEGLGDDLNNGSNLAKLKDDLKELEDKILEIFREKTDDEFYPSIFLTKASRGLMNLSTLLENAKENFLKKNTDLIKFQIQELEKYFLKRKASEIEELEKYPIDKDTEFILKKDKEKILKKCGKEEEVEYNFAIGVCPICQVRLIFRSDKCKNNSPTICEVCDNRIHHNQVASWIYNISEETIWIDEIKDKNNRITYISLKFELEDWLNGDLLNSLLGNKNDFYGLLSDIKSSILNEEILVEKLHELVKNYFQKININFNGLRNLQGRELSQNLNNSEKKNIGRIIAVYTYMKNSNLYNNFNTNIDNILAELNNIKNQFSNNFFGYILKLFDFINSPTINQFKDLLDNERNGFGKFEENIEFLQNYVSASGNINDLMNFINAEKDKVIKSKILLQQTDREYPEIKNILKRFIPFSISEEIINYFKQYQTLKNFYKEIFFSSILGTKWEDWIKQTPLNSKIKWQEEKIKWEEFTDENDPALDILSTLLLQFLLRKNPSPARLRRIWETTQEFFEKIHKNLDRGLEIPEWRKKRLVWEVNYTNKIKETGEELEGNGLKFWAQPNEDKTKIKVYLISSIEDFIDKFGTENLVEKLSKNNIDKEEIRTLFKENFEIKLKKYSEDKNKGEGETLITLTKADKLDVHSYKPYSLITDISPINYQVIIPAEYLPKFIDKVLEKYNKEFKYVYGKLPIHIGIIVANYKKPLYVNLKALRKIRRDVKNIEKLWINEDAGKFCQLQKEKLSYATTEEKINNTEDYYALYFNNLNEKDYNFYIKPKNNWKYWVSTLDKFPLNSKIKIIPNTFDFEFMDANTRRNDIYYDENKNYKRAFRLKSNRPYELEVYWSKFKVFHKLFKDKTNKAKMHKLVSLFYEKLQDYDSKYNPLLASAIINILELKKNKDAKKYISQIFDLDENTSNFQQELINKLNEEKLKLFIDMFEFWHTALKEV